MSSKYLILLILLFSGCDYNPAFNFNIDSAFQDISPLVLKANESFKQAENEILNIKPDDIIAPHPDAQKCPCKGSGLIKHGDDHVTPCPYHGKTSQIRGKNGY